ncbi:MAG: YihY/virulence factor BrkB family protein [Bacteroidota bacterium]
MKRPNFKKIYNRIVKHPRLLRFIQWTKRTSLPGFAGIPIYDVATFVYHESTRVDLFTKANSAAFSFFLSLFPSIIALFTLLPYIKSYFLKYLPAGESFDVLLQNEIKNIMPGVAGDRLFEFIDDITNNPRVGLLSIGFIMAIYFASNGMIALMRAFDKSHVAAFFSRNFWQNRIIAILLTFWLGILLIAAMVFIILGNTIISWLTEFDLINKFSAYMLLFVRWVAILMMFYFSISMIYRYGAAVREKIKIFTPGATLATILCVLSSYIFSFYVDNFNTYNKLYGSIGTIIVLMLWIQLNSLILIMGFELNASIAVNKDLKKAVEETIVEEEVSNESSA